MMKAGAFMRIVVISDSHGHGSIVDRIIRRESSADIIIFLGDVTSDIEDFTYEYTDKKFYIVSGNCDIFPSFPYTTVADVNGTKIFITHGHTLGVKSSTATLSAAARQSDCKIALYGHTHVSNIKYEDGLYIVNPGSCARSRDGGNSYAVIDIRDNGILPTIIKI
ncbi:MAG: metallophosphoesterase [Ruminococcaceae bacterium]|nr:metallophosphoesterase [Oscillospiraceae bacterium]